MTSSYNINIKDALSHLRKDPILKGIIRKHGELTWEWEGNLFSDLIESIINQQLSEKAGATIWGRFKGLFGGKLPEAKIVLAMPDEKIRECGISFAKVSYIKGICQATIDGALDPNKLATLSDEEVFKELTKLKGVGAWTAEMILMFTLKRPDVFSMGDVGLRTGIAKLYGVNRDDSEKIEKISQSWRPYRTIACRYVWRSLD